MSDRHLADQFIRLDGTFYGVHAIEKFYWAKRETKGGIEYGWVVNFATHRCEFYAPDAAPQLRAIYYAVDAQIKEHDIARWRAQKAERQTPISLPKRYALLQDFIRTSGISIRTLNNVRRFTSEHPHHPLAVGLHESPPDFRLWAETVLAATGKPDIRNLGPKSWAMLREKLASYLASLEVQP